MDFIEFGKTLRYLEKLVKMPPLIGLIVNDNKYYVDGIYDEYLLKPLNIKKSLQKLYNE